MPKESSEPVSNHERPSSFVSLLSGWVQQGLESFFATQRILVDLAMRQNTNAMKTIREGLSESEAKDSSYQCSYGNRSRGHGELRRSPAHSARSGATGK